MSSGPAPSYLSDPRNPPMADRFSNDRDDDLMFGEMPEDDDLNGLGDESEADANNDETFGGPLPSGTFNNELEDYAAQTAELRIDDPWDTPGCSSAAPPASALPMPSFDFTGFGPSSFDFLGSDSKIESIWGQTKTESLWPEDLPSMPTLHDRMDSPRKTPLAPIGQPPQQPTPKQIIPTMPKAPTLEEIEAMQMQKPSLPAIPSSAMSAEELERKILQESQSRNQQQQAGQPPLPPLPIPSLMGNVPNPISLGICPPIPPMFMPCFVPWLDVLTGRSQNLPPGCPPPPPFVMGLMNRFRNPAMVMSILTQSVTSAAGMPPPFMQPPNQQGPHHAPQSQGRQTPQSWTPHPRKPPGMPSARTIEDLAFDQFAGYMSIKERQWLVKIQILQCQGTNNPYQDDYYYLHWREKKIKEGAVAKQAKELERSETKEIIDLSKKNRRQRERNGSTSEPVDRVTTLATRFAGSLGIPTKASTHNPRHSIRVQHSEPTDEEQDKRAAGHQKKLRTLLMKIESATLLCIECQDRIEEFKRTENNQLLTEIEARTKIIRTELIEGEDFTRILQVTKGRVMFGKLLRVVTPTEMVFLLRIIVKQSRTTFAVSKCLQEIEEEFFPGLFDGLMRFNRNYYSRIATDTVPYDDLFAALQEKNTFARDLLLTLIFMCFIKKVNTQCLLLNWIRSELPIDLSTGWPSPETSIWHVLPVSREHVQTFASWLNLQVPEGARGTVAQQLAQRIMAS